ncbi:MAG: HyaD/HybD family hydrogenase maturation endopeptidase [Bifidobacteriaceae bacterium]|jgi:hydrogenase maturation protease|nr:HyaD/HybD family hydrogenase maturation endopeptidase [Bifidobacteriaceae bacterium]
MTPPGSRPQVSPPDAGDRPALRGTVLAVGNTIMSDDGLGPALLARLRAARPGAAVEYIDGGIGGLDLLPVVQEAERLLILDAVAGQTPGEVLRLDGDQLPRLLAAKLSPHQVGLLDVFSAARLLGREPAEITVVGVVPGRVALGVALTPAVEAALPQATAVAAAVLDAWEDA